MPLSAKYRWRWGWGALLWALLMTPTALALDGTLQQRQPLCARPQKNCAALFMLNAGEQVQILAQGEDPDWLEIYYPPSRRNGWLPLAALRLHVPRQSQPRELFKFSSGACPVLLMAEPFPAVAAGRSVWQLDPEALTLKAQAPLRQLSIDCRTLSPGWRTASETILLRQREQERETFLELARERPAPQPPHYQVLLRQKLSEVQAQNALTPFFTLLAEGVGPWGNAVLSLYSAAGEQQLALAAPRDLMGFLPEALRSRIRADSLQIAGLEAHGVIALVAAQFTRREKLLLRLQMTATPPWKYLGQLNWPEAVPWLPGKKQPRFRMVSRGQNIWLALAPADAPENYELFYFSVTGQPLLQERVTGLRDLWLDRHDRLWVLQPDRLSLRTLHYAEVSP
jgi:hypothetical protein